MTKDEISTVVDPNGLVSSTVLPEGHIFELYGDGTEKTIYVDGSTKEVSPNGVINETYVDGTKKITQINGSSVTYFYTGFVEEIDSDGTKTKTTPDGDYSVTQSDGIEERFYDKESNIIQIKLMEPDNSYSIEYISTGNIEVFDYNDIKFADKIFNSDNSFVLNHVDSIRSFFYDSDKVLIKTKSIFKNDSGFYALFFEDSGLTEIYNSLDNKVGNKTIDSKNSNRYFITFDDNGLTEVFNQNDQVIGVKEDSILGDGMYVLNINTPFIYSKLYGSDNSLLGSYNQDLINNNFFYITYEDDNRVSHYNSIGELLSIKKINDNGNYTVSNPDSSVVEFYNNLDFLIETKNINNDKSYHTISGDNSLFSYYDTNENFIYSLKTNIDGSTVRTESNGSYIITSTDSLTIKYYDNTTDNNLVKTKVVDNIDDSYTITSADSLTIQYYDNTTDNNLVKTKVINSIDNSYTITTADSLTIQYYDNTTDNNLVETKVINSLDNSYTITSADSLTIQYYDNINDNNLVETKVINNTDNSYIITSTDELNVRYYDSLNFLYKNTIDNNDNTNTNILYNIDGSYSTSTFFEDSSSSKINYDINGVIIDTRIFDSLGNYFVTYNNGLTIDSYDFEDFLYQNTVDNNDNTNTIYEYFKGTNESHEKIVNNDGSYIEKQYDNGILKLTKKSDINGYYNTELVSDNILRYYDFNDLLLKTISINLDNTLETETEFYSNGLVKKIKETNISNDSEKNYFTISNNDGSHIEYFKDNEFQYKNKKIDSEGIITTTFYNEDGTFMIETTMDNSVFKVFYNADATINRTESISSDNSSVVDDGNGLLTYIDQYLFTYKTVQNNTPIPSFTIEEFNTDFSYSVTEISSVDGTYVKIKYNSDETIYSVTNGVYESNYNEKIGDTTYFYDHFGALEKKVTEDNSESTETTEIYKSDGSIDYIVIKENDNSYTKSFDNIVEYYDINGLLVKTFEYEENGAYLVIYEDGITENEHYDLNGIIINDEIIDLNLLEYPYTIEILAIENEVGFFNSKIIMDGYVDMGVGEFSYFSASNKQVQLTTTSVDSFHWYKNEISDYYTRVIAYNGEHYYAIVLTNSSFELDKIISFYGGGEITEHYEEYENSNYIEQTSHNVSLNAFELSSLEITTTEVSLSAGKNLQLNIIGKDLNNNEMNLNKYVTWEVDSALASINENGFLSAEQLLGDILVTASIIGLSEEITIEITEYTPSVYLVDIDAVGDSYPRNSSGTKYDFEGEYVAMGYGEVVISNSSAPYYFRLSYSDDNIQFSEYYMKDNGDGSYMLIAYGRHSAFYGFYKVTGDPSSFENVIVEYTANGHKVSKHTVDNIMKIDYANENDVTLVE